MELANNPDQNTMKPTDSIDKMELDNLKSNEDPGKHDTENKHDKTSTLQTGDSATLAMGDTPGLTLNGGHESYRKLRPFPLKITKFNNKYLRYSVHSIIFIIIMAVIVGIGLLVEGIPGGNDGAPMFKIYPQVKSADNLIQVQSGPEGNSGQLLESIDKFLAPYRHSLPEPLAQSCTETSLDNNYYCFMMNETRTSRCVPETKYGYKYAQPCVAIDLRPLNDWLCDKNTTGAVVKTRCDGEYSPDKEYVGPVEYFPARGVPAEYFNRVNGLSPYIFVHLTKSMYGVLFFVRCQFVLQSPTSNATVYEHYAKFKVTLDY